MTNFPILQQKKNEIFKRQASSSLNICNNRQIFERRNSTNRGKNFSKTRLFYSLPEQKYILEKIGANLLSKIKFKDVLFTLA